MKDLISQILQEKAFEFQKNITGAFGSGKLAFSAAKAVFDTVKKPEVQRGLIAAGKNEAIRSTALSVARNEKARKPALSALQNERTLKAVSNIAEAYDRGWQQQQQRGQRQMDLINFDNAAVSRTTNKGELYPALPSSRDYAPYKEYKAATDFTAIHSQLASLNLYSPSASANKSPPRPGSSKLDHSEVQETLFGFSSSNQGQPYGYAKFRFLASHFDELSMEPDDVILLEKKVDDQWIYAVNERTGQKGIVPLLFVDIKIPLPTAFVSTVPEVPFYARALFDFNSDVQGDLTFHANDDIYVTERVSNEWLRGIIGTRQGIFPANYVQEITPLSTAPLAAATKIITHDTTPEYVTAAYDYNSAVIDDLVFRAGDKIEVVEWVSEDWLKGRLNGKVGLVPRTYIFIVDTNKDIGTGTHVSDTSTVVTATKDYYTVADNHLCFSKGDQIEVIEEVNSDWLKGKLLLDMSNTRSFPTGLFPRSAIS